MFFTPCTSLAYVRHHDANVAVSAGIRVAVLLIPENNVNLRQMLSLFGLKVLSALLEKKINKVTIKNNVAMISLSKD